MDRDANAQENDSIREQDPSHKVTRNILEQIVREDLSPGERLKSIRKLTARYGVSQHAVIKGLKRLVEHGVLESKDRSGYYLRPGAKEIAQDLIEEDSKADVSSDDSMKLSTPFYVPKVATSALSIYVSELYPSTLQVWRDLLDEFENEAGGNRKIRLLSSQDGHFEEVVPEEQPEVVLASSEVLAHHEADDYVTPASDVVSVDRSNFVKPVGRFAEEMDGLPGIPFSLTFHRTFANLNWFGKTGKRMDATNLARAVKRLFSGKDAGDAKIIMHSLLPWLFIRGAMQYDRGGVRFDAEVARQSLELFKDLNIRLVPDVNRFPKAVVDGGYACAIHFSYIATLLEEHAGFRWRGTALPFSSDGVDMSAPLLLAVRRDCRTSDLCGVLIEHLTSIDAQKRYGALGANLPARETAAFSSEVLESMDITAEILQDHLSRLFIPVPNGFMPMLGQRCRTLAQDVEMTGLNVDDVCDRMQSIIAGINKKYGSS